VDWVAEVVVTPVDAVNCELTWLVVENDNEGEEDDCPAPVCLGLER
jgi:hypothetical protein